MEKFRLKKMDPRAQFFAGVLAMISVLFLKPAQNSDSVYYFILLLFVWTLVREELFSIFKDILRVYPMFLLITLPLPFQKIGSSEVIFQTGLFTLYGEGCRQFFVLQLKAFFLLNISFALLRSLSYKQVIALLDSWRIPHWIISIYFYLHRMLQVFSLEATRIKLALQARSIRLTGVRSLPVFGSFVLLYLFRLSERSERSSQAMLSRGFSGRFPVTVQLHWCFTDTMFFAGTFFLTSGFWLWRLW